jgi:hypothetical protein
MSNICLKIFEFFGKKVCVKNFVFKNTFLKKVRKRVKKFKNNFVKKHLGFFSFFSPLTLKLIPNLKTRLSNLKT